MKRVDLFLLSALSMTIACTPKSTDGATTAVPPVTSTNATDATSSTGDSSGSDSSSDTGDSTLASVHADPPVPTACLPIDVAVIAAPVK